MPEPPDDLTPRQINLDEESARARYPLEKFTQRRTRPRVSEPDTVQQQAGRMPPQAVDVEQAVLGAMLIAPEAIPQAIEVLSDEAFYQPKHQKVYRAMLSLFERGNPVDLITLTDELKRRGELDDVGGAYYLTELTARVASAANVEHHARIIAEKSLVRQMIEVMTRLVGVAYDPGTDAFDLLDEAERDIFRISESQLRKSSRSMSDVVKETIERLQSIHGMEGGITGVPSGFTRLDDMTSGWQPSD
ncbi:MAG: DnaB-like helicase N-terminal domain-containing protein, partial [Bacteroidota bacterium]